MEEFDVVAVKSKANAKATINPEESRDIYKQELMDWIDYYNEVHKDNPTAIEAITMKNKIINLWIEYALFEKSIRQYKKAVQVYEDALNDPITNQSVELILSYASYCIERSKKSNAQKNYIRGLSIKGLTTDEYDKIWFYFLTFMNSENVNQQLNVKQLYEAIQLQLKELADSIAPPSEHFSYEQLKMKYENSSVLSIAESKSDDLYTSVQTARSNTNNALAEAVLASINVPKVSSTSKPTTNDGNITSDEMPVIIVPPIDVLPLQSEIDDFDDLTGLTPEIITHVYNSKPPMLFSTADKEPMIFGISTLTPEDIVEIDAFLGVSIVLLASAGTYTRLNTHCDYYMDILQGLWVTQAFKERQFDLWFSELRQLHLSEEYVLKSKIEALKLQNAIEADIQAAENEYKIFQNKSLVQRELLHCITNKVLYCILLQQQVVLSNLSFPYFNTSIIEKLEKCISYSRSNINSSSHPMNPYEHIPELYDLINKQSRLVNAVLSISLKSLIIPPPMPPNQLPAMFDNEIGIKRTSSIESDRLNDWRFDTNSNMNNKRRKKRRKTNNVAPDNLLMQFYPSNNTIENYQQNQIDMNNNLPVHQQLSQILQQFKK